MVCCLKAMLFPITVFSLPLRLSQYVQIYFEFFYLLNSVLFRSLSFTQCFPQKLCEILLLDVTSTEVLQSQKTSQHKHIDECQLSASVGKIFAFKLLAGLY